MKTSNFDEPLNYKQDTVLFVEGEPSHFLYIVKKGKVRVIKEDEDRGRLFPISVIESNAFIGELSIFSDGKRSATAIVTESSEIVVLSKSEIRKIVKLCPSWVKTLLEVLSVRLRTSVEILREHKIVDDLPASDATITSEQEKKYKTLIKDYRSRKNLA